MNSIAKFTEWIRIHNFARHNYTAIVLIIPFPYTCTICIILAMLSAGMLYAWSPHFPDENATESPKFGTLMKQFQTSYFMLRLISSISFKALNGCGKYENTVSGEQEKLIVMHVNLINAHLLPKLRRSTFSQHIWWIKWLYIIYGQMKHMNNSLHNMYPRDPIWCIKIPSLIIVRLWLG